MAQYKLSQLNSNPALSLSDLLYTVDVESGTSYKSTISEVLGLVPGGVSLSVTNNWTASQIFTATTSTVPVCIVGQSGQTANLLEIKDVSGGAVVSSIDKAGLVSSLGLSVTSSAAAAIPVSIKGFASQSGDLTQWKNSANTVLTKVSSSGAITAPSITATTAMTTAAAMITNTAVCQPTVASTVALVAKGAASQTGDLTQWQNSAGTTLAKVDAAGVLTAVSITATSTANGVAISNINGIGCGADGNGKTLNFGAAQGTVYLNGSNHLYFYNPAGTARSLQIVGGTNVDTVLVMGGNAGAGSGHLRLKTFGTSGPGVIEAGNNANTWQEAMEFAYNAGGVRLSFFGATAVARQTGGAATAGATYTTTEQTMINAMYTALQAYGLLT